MKLKELVGQLKKIRNDYGFAGLSILTTLANGTNPVVVRFCPSCLYPHYTREIEGFVEFNSLGDFLSILQATETSPECPSCGARVVSIEIPKSTFLELVEKLFEHFDGSDIERALVVASILLAEHGIVSSPEHDLKRLRVKALLANPRMYHELKAVLGLKDENDEDETLKTLKALSRVITTLGPLKTRILLDVLAEDKQYFDVSFCGDCLNPFVDIKLSLLATLSPTGDPIHVESTDSTKFECSACGSSFTVTLTTNWATFSDVILKLLEKIPEDSFNEALVLSGILLYLKGKAELSDMSDYVTPQELLERAKKLKKDALEKVAKVLGVEIENV